MPSAYIVKTYDSAYDHSNMALYQSDLLTESDIEPEEQTHSRPKRSVEKVQGAQFLVVVSLVRLSHTSFYFF